MAGSENPGTRGKMQQTFRLSKPLVEVLDAMCSDGNQNKGEVVEALLRKALEMPPSPDQEVLSTLYSDCLKYFGSRKRLGEALSILMDDKAVARRLKGWVVNKCIPAYVAPYLVRLASVADIAVKTINERITLESTLQSCKESQTTPSSNEK